MTKSVNVKKPLIYKEDININDSEKYISISEQFKSKNSTEKIQKISNFLKENAGEPHPFDYGVIEGLEKKFGLVSAVEDKFCDYVLGPGIFFESDDKKVKEFLENWVSKKYLEIYLRPWFKNGLGKGSGYLEVAGLNNENEDEAIKVVDSETVFIKRDEYGVIKEINQVLDYNKILTKKEVIPLDKDNIIQININQIGSSAYGYGIIYSGIIIIDNFLSTQKSVHTLMKRKANSPIHAKIGNVEKEDYPSQEDINGFGKNLQYMNESTEWVTGPNVEMKVLDFGNISEKFKELLDNDMKLMSYAFQMPESILGAERSFVGAVKIQDEGFSRKIKAYQQQIGFVLKTQLFDKLLEKNGYTNVDYKVIWGKQTEAEKDKLRNSYQKLLSSTSQISQGLRMQYEKKLALLDDIDIEEVNVENLKQMRRDNRQAKKQFKRQITLQQTPQQMNHKIQNSIEKEYLLGKAPQEIEAKIVKNYSITEDKAFESVKEVIDEYEKDYSLEEWVGEYVQIKNHILERIAGDQFTNLAAKNAQDRALGLLNKKQVEKLREIMKKGFEENKGLKTLSNEIKKLKLKDRYIMKNGEKKLAISADKRPYQIARTETVRFRADGTLLSLQDKGKRRVEFVTQSTHPCPECESLDGDIYNINESFGIIPVHGSCRCRWIEA